ncbi:MAG: hypothetical protein A2600_11055 [Candidatus Lambdaproteobacteria bacterium RIFOXYD1_FULL_56_27]|uniref:Glycosyltransferase 2-like domain-containing protein n=1 Tax=Candidatus Lambdaproteobacteria bacterium RIFOXYD2_FULL_56_26 TaxID=1817773 RepID=A0A1F6H1U7_9PROT|nr:MAG: hypothetical protein A2557_10800 [Candidatus Lambdaproteobacteria bacterium RIFOXYD2_FULL_56_26]OGH05691.1 MAG: hypothetical protein A2426_04130 [Candidatus Lambdaproteobacteria bacterium RIFOXYC1_FULL_56_13]OGH08442.1 MAG: hypothetical protein A2600_11055 [Candidatus Lambdaproteobacteria bacterium RIFOXYD1_FULL_56_27]
MKLTGVVITYNEEANLKDCLTSLDFCDFLLVVDSDSTDQTKAIAQDQGARVLNQPFLGHVKQKQFALEQAQTDWVLFLDADERLGPELRASILALKEQVEPRHWGYEVSRKSFHLGRWILHGGWYPDRGIRLFHKEHGRWSGYDPHDKVEVEGPVARLEGDLEHFVFRNLSHNVQKNDFYSSIMAQDLFAQGKRPSLAKLLLKPPYKFFECYLLKAGFLDGLPGLIIAVGAAYSIFLKFAKLWELGQNDPKSRP